MEFNTITVLFALCIVGVMAGQKECMHKKYEADLGERYSKCHNRSGSLDIPKMKQCFQEVMKAERVVKVANDGQMTVDRVKVGEYAEANKNKNVGRAMKTCYDNHDSGNDLYKEAARFSQCVFLGMKTGC